MRSTQCPDARSAASTRRLTPAILVACLVAVAFIAGASPPEPGGEALPLPLDHSIHGYATAGEPALYALDVTAPALVVIESHATGSPAAAHAVRWLGRDGQARSSHLSLSAIRGRHVQRIAETGTYFVEITASAAAGAGFHLYAWTVDRQETDELCGGCTKTEPMDETDELIGGCTKTEPMDETDELIGGCPKTEPMDETDELIGGCPKTEPMDETDELIGGCPKTEPMDETDELVGTASWREIPGYGLLETVAGGQIRQHPWCSWTERPELLSTFSCAREVRVAGTRTIAVDPVSPAGVEMIGLDLAAGGRVTVEAPAAVFDAGGRLLAEPDAGEPVWLEAGRAFVRIDTGAGREAVVLDVEID